jgi:hypothetical protein
MELALDPLRTASSASASSTRSLGCAAIVIQIAVVVSGRAAGGVSSTPDSRGRSPRCLTPPAAILEIEDAYYAWLHESPGRSVLVSGRGALSITTRPRQGSA